jgi:ureidoglycolate hydrolase
MDLVAERLTQEAFAPYGDVIAVPVRPGLGG